MLYQRKHLIVNLLQHLENHDHCVMVPYVHVGRLRLRLLETAAAKLLLNG